MENTERFQAEIDFDRADLEPILSAETVDFHYGRHHCGYAKNLNSLIEGTKFQNLSLEEIIIESRARDNAIFNNASQLFNHNFYWKCLKNGPLLKNEQFKNLIEAQFKTFDNFLMTYAETANKLFASGWSWLVFDGTALKILNTQNAENPIGTGQTPVFVIDLWEHAYYIDFRNDRASYINKILRSSALHQ